MWSRWQTVAYSGSWNAKLDWWLLHHPQMWIPFNPLDSKGNYSAASNNTKSVRWPSMGEWAVTFGTARRGLGWLWPHPVPSSLYQMKKLTHQRPVYQSLYCYMMVRLLCGFNVAIKGLRRAEGVHRCDERRRHCARWRRRHQPLRTIVDFWQKVWRISSNWV